MEQLFWFLLTTACQGLKKPVILLVPRSTALVCGPMYKLTNKASSQRPITSFYKTMNEKSDLIGSFTSERNAEADSRIVSGPRHVD